MLCQHCISQTGMFYRYNTKPTLMNLFYALLRYRYR